MLTKEDLQIIINPDDYPYHLIGQSKQEFDTLVDSVQAFATMIGVPFENLTLLQIEEIKTNLATKKATS